MRRTGVILILGLFLGMMFIVVPQNVTSAAPTITENGATPTTASWISNIDFFMNYTDADDDTPTYTYVEVGGTNYTMIANDSTDTTYTDGKYYFYENSHFWNTTHSFRFWVDNAADSPVSTAYQTFTIESGEIWNITGNSEDGIMRCRDTTYNDCLVYDGTLDYSIDTTHIGHYSGQIILSGKYLLYQSFLTFDTSVLPDTGTIDHATLYLKLGEDYSINAEFDNNVYHNTNGTYWWDNTSSLQEKDWIPQSDVSSLYEEGSILNSTNYVNGTTYALNLQPSWISTEGNTRYVGISSRYGITSTTEELDIFYSSDSSGNEPYLLIDLRSPSVIEITSPNEGTVHGTIDMTAKVTSSNTVNQVTFYLEKYYVATYDSSSQTYRYGNFITELLSDGYYTITARVNFTGGEYATDEVQILVNNDHQDCFFDYILRVWDCPPVRYYVPNNYDAVKGHFEKTKGTEYTYWAMEYLYIEKSTGTSNAFYQPYDSTTYTDNDPYLDRIEPTNFDPSNRAYINDTKSTASTADDTELENSTYLNLYIASGQNVTVESAVSMKVYRVSDIFIAKDFEWGTSGDTGIWIYQWEFANNLQSTIERAAVYIPFKEEANIGSVLVKDADGSQLNAGKDYDVSGAGVFVGFKDLSAGSTLILTLSYSRYVFGTDITEPTITIVQNDVATEPVTHNGRSVTLATKTVTNPNNFKFTGRMYVTWATDHKPDHATIDCEDDDGSDYECFFDMYGQLIVQDVSFGIGDEDTIKTFYFYYDILTPPSTFDALPLVLPFLLIILSIITVVTLPAIRSDEKHRREAALIIGGGCVTAIVIILGILLLLRL